MHHFLPDKTSYLAKYLERVQLDAVKSVLYTHEVPVLYGKNLNVKDETMPHAHEASDAPTIASELAAFLDDARGRRGLSEHTVASYGCDLRTAAAAITEPLSTITTSMLESFLSSRNEKPSTTNRRIASLRRFFLWAARQHLCGYCQVNL